MIYNFITDIGRVRNENEDSILTINQNEVGLFVVADGMGGHSNGKMASMLAVQTFQEWWIQNLQELVHYDEDELFKRLKMGVTLANDTIIEASKKNGQSMGTTLTISLMIEKKVYIVHVGDSRVYTYSCNLLTQITDDDTKSFYDFKNGFITKEQYLKCQNDNTLMKCLGFVNEIIPQFYTVDLQNDDLLFMCTDGVYNYYSHNELSNFMSDFSKDKKFEKLSDMKNHILERGAKDNFSASLVII